MNNIRLQIYDFLSVYTTEFCFFNFKITHPSMVLAYGINGHAM